MAAAKHAFPGVKHIGGRRLSTEIRGYITQICSKRQLEHRYAHVTVPEWVDYNDHARDEDWGMGVDSLENLHKNTFGQVLDSGFNENNRPGGGKVYCLTMGVWRDATFEENIEKLSIYNFKRVLREIEVRGPDIKTHKLGEWKSPIYSHLRPDLPIKGAHTVTLTCGGGGGSIACC